jgi:cytochrome b561
VHWGLYALIIVQPLVGWAATSVYRAPIIVYGLFELPPILAEPRAIPSSFSPSHRALGPHGRDGSGAHPRGPFSSFIRKDRVLMRMISGG